MVLATDRSVGQVKRNKYRRPAPPTAAQRVRQDACARHDYAHAGYDCAGFQILRCRACGRLGSLLDLAHEVERDDPK